MKQIEDLLLSVKQETDTYINLLQKWQKAVNLVSGSTLSDIWNRHILDSAQLYPFIPKDAKTLVDMGSGAGFPGLVLALLNYKLNGPLKQIYLIESDNKKCIFLQEVSRQLSLPVIIRNQRLEKVNDIPPVDVVTARALADVSQLLTLAKPFINSQTICLFLKGESVDQELKNMPVHCQVEKVKSITNSKSYITRITEVSYD